MLETALSLPSMEVSEENDALHFFEIFPWNKNFDTGNHIIDEQHKELVRLLNSLANTLVGNQQYEIESAFSALAKYADYHFSSEEEVWSEYFVNDHWLHSHQLSHGAFLPKVLEIKEHNTTLPFYLIVEDIVKFLIRWLAFHILNEDRRYAIVVSEVRGGKTLEEAKNIAERKMNASSVRLLTEAVLTMYDGLSTRALNLLRERRARLEAEGKLRLAYEELEEVNKRLEESSITDYLTGLHNRRYFDTIFSKELKRARRDQSPLALLLIDVDHFKTLNDTYGHLKGDEALIQISAKFRQICRRPGDYVFRIGGEEFAVLICDKSRKCKLLEFGDVLRKAIRSLNIPNINSKVEPVLTISLGVAEVIPDKTDSVRSIYKKADFYLYQAKQKGRNRVVGNSISEG